MHHLPYDLHMPADCDTATLFASPHSGRDYPQAFIAQSPLSLRVLRSSEDAFVDTLFSAAPLHGAALLAARVPRAYVDLNRSVEELDPALIEGVVKTQLNPRISSGLGVIPRVVAGGRVIHPGRLRREVADARLAACWMPYHSKLQDLLMQSRLRFGHALLIDCHSMPHEALAALSVAGRPLPEVVLGDRHGVACAPWLVARIESAFTRAGFRVARNVPFAGAYIAQTYGRPSVGQHVVQVEIDRSLYMDEASILPRPDFESFQTRIASVVQELAELGRQLSVGALAAE